MMNLPKHWKMMNREPFNAKDPKPDAVYAIAFFTLKRAILYRRDYTVLTTMETRKARQLIDEAHEAGFTGVFIKGSKLGVRPETHPKESDIMYFTEIVE